jgi:hypothetical protein
MSQPAVDGAFTAAGLAQNLTVRLPSWWLVGDTGLDPMTSTV